MKNKNKNLTNLITSHELGLRYLRTYQNVSVKCHSVNETRSFVDLHVFPQYLYQ